MRMLITAIAVILFSTHAFAAQNSFDKALCPELEKVHITCDFTNGTKLHAPNSSSIDAKGDIHVYGADGTEPWYIRGVKPGSLKQAIALERGFLGANNPYWKGHLANRDTCAALAAVGISCDYNTRVTLSTFLTVNGKGLFPAMGRTNPYVFDDNGKLWRSLNEEPDDVYIGAAVQNPMLAKAVRRNMHLFKQGDLMSADVKRWR